MEAAVPGRLVLAVDGRLEAAPVALAVVVAAVPGRDAVRVEAAV